MNDQGQAPRIHELEQIIANCSVCGGLGLTKPDVRDPADPRFGKFVPCPACGPAVRELHEMRLMELLREPINRYTALVGDLRACTFENFDARRDGRLAGRAVGRIARQVFRAARAGRKVVLVSSAAIQAGVGALRLAGRPKRMPELQAAAAVVVALGLSILAWNGIGIAPAPEEAEVLLGSDSDMTEQRFVDLTREVLQADRRYHSAMFRIMEQVVRDTGVSREASAEDLMQRTDEGRAAESAEAAEMSIFSDF